MSRGPNLVWLLVFSVNFRKQKKNCWMRVMSMSFIDLKIQQQCHVTVSPYANRQFPLRKISQHKRLKANNKKKHKIPKSIIATHTSTMPSSRQHPKLFFLFHIFRKPIRLPTPKTRKKRHGLLPWPIGCQTLPHRHPGIMMPQRQEYPPRSTQRHRVRVRGSVDPPRPPDTSGRCQGMVFQWRHRNCAFLLGGVQLQQQNSFTKKKLRTFGVVVFFCYVAIVVLSARVHISCSVIFSCQIEQSSINGTCSINDQGSLPTNTKSNNPSMSSSPSLQAQLFGHNFATVIRSPFV